MALRGPVRESSVLLGSIFDPTGRATQEKRWQRPDPDQQFPLNRTSELMSSAQRKIPSPKMKTAGSPRRQPFVFSQASRD